MPCWACCKHAPWLFRRKANPRSPPCTPQNPSFPFQFQVIAGGSHHLPAPCCNRRGFYAEKQIPALRHAHLKTLHSHFNFKQSRGSHHLPVPCCNRRGFSAEKQIPALRHAHLKTLHSHFNFKQSPAALTTCQRHAATARMFPILSIPCDLLPPLCPSARAEK